MRTESPLAILTGLPGVSAPAGQASGWAFGCCVLHICVLNLFVVVHYKMKATVRLVRTKKRLLLGFEP